jgi:DNA-binding transcriptional ArsR family regulator
MKQEIIEAVEQSPGIHFRGLTREIDCSPSTIDYHFKRTDKLKDRDIRGYRRLYPVEVPEDYESSLAALNHPVRARILYGIERKDLKGFSDIEDAVDVSKSTLSTHMNVLSEAELVEVEKRGNRKFYTVSNPVRKSIREFTTSTLREMESNFIEMWE